MTTAATCTRRRLPAAIASVFVLLLSHVACFAPNRRHSRASPLQMNFFKDMLAGAFENDPTLSEDKSKGQYDGPNDEPPASRYEPTSVQQKWRESTQKAASKAPLNAQLLENTRWTVDLFLAGVASKDPSNDLFGAKVNISSRDKKVGLNLPDKPSTTVEVEFLPGGICKASPSPFTSGEVDGQWKFSDDGAMLRFSLNVVGYSRTIQTRGTITNVFWTDEEEKTTETSSSYTIPPGFIYADASIGQGSTPGTLKINDGILRVEQKRGLLGAASTMVSCGGFSATGIYLFRYGRPNLV